MNSYLFYPGCSMESSAKAYYDSLMTISGPLGLGLEEIKDWNCCGATEYASTSTIPAYSLIGRNLALAEKQANGSHTVVAPCSACYLNLSKADYYMRENRHFEEKVNLALGAGGLHYDAGSLQIRHLLDVIVNDIGLENLKKKVVRPLTGLRVAPYLGCMVPRPDYEKRFSSHEYPHEMDRLLRTLGAEVIDFPLKTHCCGGHMTLISPEMAFELIRRLVISAEQYRAHMMVTLCPMCQMNLDAYQGETNKHFHTNYNMPILFFTQLIGLALGLDPKKLGFGSEMVAAAPALANIGVQVPAPEAPPARKKVRKEGLPMPRMQGEEESNE
jgi:heterodisulfide reductase subunit B